MTEITKIDGSPGGGKTHTLKRHLRDEKQGGLGPEQFYWLNFTTTGCDDVELEIVDLWPNEDGVAKRAKTLHGLALSLAIRDGIIDGEDVEDAIIQQGAFDDDETDPFAEFCSEQALPYDPEAANPRKLLSGESKTEHAGNKLFAINDYLRQTCKPPEQNPAAPVDIRTPRERVKHLLQEWDQYKRVAHDVRLFEHGDYVDEVIARTLVPAVDVLLIDEFQDLAPLEYKLYKQWRDSGQIDRIYIAGDPNQSIYSFRGGTPLYFEETDVDGTTTLKESYRCPSRIANVARTVLDAHQQTDARGFDGKEDGGVVDWPTIRDEHDLTEAVTSKIDSGNVDTHHPEPEVMLLTRTNYQLKGVMNALRNTGIPFQTLGRGGVWDNEMCQYHNFLTGWQNGRENFAKANMREVLKALPGGQKRRREVDKGTVNAHLLPRERVLPAFEGLTPIETAERLDIKRWQRETLVNALEAPVDLPPELVRVGTIHTSKGLEAPIVYLFANTSKRSVTRYRRDDDQAAEEHRTWYVGATRASKELHIVDSFFEGPIAPPIKTVKMAVTA